MRLQAHLALSSMEKKETVMPTDTIVTVTAIVAMFSLFAVVLAWGDQRTRKLARKT